MSRSLFALLAARHGERPTSAARRRFLAASVAAGAGLVLSGCGATGSRRVAGSRGGRVVVVGAGLAGLACAYELAAVGYDVRVVEARTRVGGRVLSFNDRAGTGFVPGRNVEGGGELIGSNHPLWAAYAERFGLRFVDVTGDEDLAAPVVIAGRVLTGAESAALYTELERGLAGMNADARRVDPDEPWRSPDAAAIDARSVAQRIAAMDVSPLAKAAVTAQLAGDNAVATDRQSDLALLAAINGPGPESYWTESEVYRCQGGNQQLAQRLAGSLGDRVTLGRAVVAIADEPSGCVVTLDDGGRLPCDHAVLAVPPSVWSSINAPIPEGYAPQMGEAVKHLARVRSRFWRDAGIGQYALRDDAITWTWDGTDNQPGPGEACLTAFSGGPAAARVRAVAPAGRDSAYARWHNAVFPGYNAAFVASRFMDWPSDPLTRAGYSFPAPGEVTRVLPKLHVALGRLRFAGEHTCVKFVGYMEGALQSGVRVAREIASADGVRAAP